MVTLEKKNSRLWKDNCPVVMVKDFHGNLHYSKSMTDLLRNNDPEALFDVFAAQRHGHVEVH